MNGHLVAAAIGAAILAGAATVHADAPVAAEAPASAPRRDYHLDFAPVMAVPLGSMSDATGPGIGGLLGLSYSLSELWQLVGHTGYLEGAETGFQVSGVSVSSRVSYAPALVGAKYYVLGSDPIRLYAMGEAGVLVVNTSASASAGATNSSGSDTSVHVGSAVSMGLELGLLDLRAGLLTVDLAHADQSSAALASLGFRFAGF